MTKPRTQSGFTLVELTIAMAIFAAMLLIVSVAFLNIVHMREASAAARSTQQNSRAMMEEVIRTVRGTHFASVSTGAGGSRLCLVGTSSTAIFYLSSKSTTPYDNALKEDTINDTSATACTGTPVSSRSLSSSDVAVVDFHPIIIPPTVANHPSSVQVELRVASDASLLNGAATPAQAACDPSKAGAEFCSVTVLQSAASLGGT